MDERTGRGFYAVLLLSVFTGVVAAAFYQYFPILHRDTLSITDGSSCCALITHLFTGAVYPWRFDPISSLLLVVGGAQLFFGAYAALAAFGMGMLFGEKAIFAPLVTLLLILFLGFDTALFGTLSWYPLILCAFGLARPYVALVFLSAAISYGNSALGTFLVLFALAERSLSKPRSIKSGIALSVLLPVMLFLVASPFPDLGTYPPFARTFPEHSQLGGLDPLIGGALSMRTIDRGYVEQAYLPIMLLLSLILLIDLIVFKAKPREEICRWAKIVSLGLLFCLFLDSSAFPEAVRIVAPLYSISRMIPGLALLPLAPFAAGLALIYLGIYLSKRYWSRERRVAVIAAIVAAVLLQSGKLGAERLNRFELSDLSSLSESDGAWIRRVIHSPSYNLLKIFGVQRLLEVRDEKPLRFRSLSEFRPQLEASNNQERLHVLLDEEKAHRWSSAKGRQDGDEWILVKFGRARELQGLKLVNKAFHSDFPRGMEILVAEECDSKNPNFRSVFREPDWQGRLALSVDGLPYIRSQSEIEIGFQAVSMQCVMIKQIGSTSHYEWSVTDIQVALAE